MQYNQFSYAADNVIIDQNVFGLEVLILYKYNNDIKCNSSLK